MYKSKLKTYSIPYLFGPHVQLDSVFSAKPEMRNLRLLEETMTRVNIDTFGVSVPAESTVIVNYGIHIYSD